MKLNFQPAQYKKYKFDKDNFEKKSIKKIMQGNTVARQKSCGGNTVAIHSVIFEKTTKLNSRPA